MNLAGFLLLAVLLCLGFALWIGAGFLVAWFLGRVLNLSKNNGKN